MDLRAILAKLQLAVPRWHIYAHVMNCQLQNHPFLKMGFGLTDGEGTERCWWKFKWFKKLTKMMKPEHRIDLLTERAIYINERLQQNIGSHLVHRYLKAKHILETTPVTAPQHCESMSSGPEPQTTAEIVQMTLYKIQKLSQVQPADPSFAHSCQDLARLRKKLLDFLPDSPIPDINLTILGEAVKKERLTITATAANLAAERQYYLSIIPNADGQSIIIRLNNKLKVLSNKIEKCVVEYNSYSDVAGPSVTFEQFKNVTTIAEVAPQLNRYYIRQRAEEELQMVLDEADRTKRFFQESIDDLMPYTSDNSPNAPYFRVVIQRVVGLRDRCEDRLKYLSDDLSSDAMLEVTAEAQDGEGDDVLEKDGMAPDDRTLQYRHFP